LDTPSHSPTEPSELTIFLPGTDLATVTALELDRVADELNDRPRKRRDFYKPTERPTELLFR
jgi:transposase, IS30 family